MKKRGSFSSCFSCFFPTAVDSESKTEGGKSKRRSSTDAGFYVHHNTLYENGALSFLKKRESSHLVISQTPSKLLPNNAENETSEDLFASQKPSPVMDQAIATVLQPPNSPTSSSSSHGEDEADAQSMFQEMTNLNDEKHLQQITVVEEQAQTTLPGEAAEEDLEQSLDAVVTAEKGITSHPVTLERIISYQSVETKSTNEEELSPSDME